MSAALELLGGGGDRIRRAFEFMGLAEEEIAAAMKRHPARASEVNAAFRILCPTMQMTSLVPGVYLAHVRELLERVASGEDARPATRAEALCVLQETSLKAPLGQAAALLYERLFAEVVPGVFADEVHRAPWPEAVAEVLHDLRRRFARADRRRP